MIDSTYLLVDFTSETKKLTEKRVFLPSEKLRVKTDSVLTMEKSQQITTKEKLLLEGWKFSAEQDSKYFVFEKLSNNSQMMKHFMCALSTTSGPCCFQQSRRDKMNLHINTKRHIDVILPLRLLMRE
jgi:hypothetical protein